MSRRSQYTESVRSAYLRNRWLDDDNDKPQVIYDAVVFEDGPTQLTSQRRVFSVVALYFVLVATVAALLEFDATTGKPLISARLLPALAHVWDYFFFVVGGLAMFMATRVLYAARFFPRSLHVAALALHACTVGAIVASVDAFLSSHTQGALFSAVFVACAFVVVLATMTRPLGDPRVPHGTPTRHPGVVALASWAAVAIATAVAYLIHPALASGVEIAVALSVGFVVVMFVCCDAAFVFRRITAHETLNGATYLVVDSFCFFSSMAFSLAMTVAMCALLFIGSTGLVGCCSCGGGCGCGCGSKEAGVQDASMVAHKDTKQCNTTRRRCRGVCTLLRQLGRLLVAVGACLGSCFCCCLTEKLDGDHDKRGISTVQVMPFAATAVVPVENQVMQR